MIPFLWNIALAFIWAAATEQFSLANMLFGFVLGYIILWFLQPVHASANYFVTTRRAVALMFSFLWELLLSNLRVAQNVISPRYTMRPGIIAIPLSAETDLEITLLASLITLTPGTLSLDVSDDRRTLYIHAMFVDDPDSIRREIKDGFERRILETLR